MPEEGKEMGAEEEHSSPTIAAAGNADENDAGAAAPEAGDAAPDAAVVATPAVATGDDVPDEQQQAQAEQPQRQAVVAPLPLDWTKMGEAPEDTNPANIVRYPWDVSTIDEEALDLQLVGTHGQKITRMGKDLSKRLNPNVESLVLRSHLIRTMEGIANMEKLELLELYDNMVDELRELDGTTADGKEGGEPSWLPGKNLRVLDMSYNVIRDMGPVSLCPNLQELYIAQNKIKTMKGLKGLKLLRKIDLGANRIRVMDGEELSGMENLEELWLGKNKIEKITGLENLKKLRRLDVQANRLTSVENLESQSDTLEELYLAHNGIDVEGATRDTGLALNFTQLNTLDLSRNRLTDASPFGHLKSLTDLWISGNDIKSFDDVEPLRSLTELDAVYLEMNPVADDFEYRKRLAEMIPSLTQIDATMIGGPAMHGYGGAFGSIGGGMDLAGRMRAMQDVALQKAKAEEEAKAGSFTVVGTDGTAAAEVPYSGKSEESVEQEDMASEGDEQKPGAAPEVAADETESGESKPGEDSENR